MGKGAQVYLGSAELGAVCAKLGRLPSLEEYLQIVPQKLGQNTAKVYKYLEFDKIKDFAL